MTSLDTATGLGTATSSRYFPFIDGLRCLAVCAVIAHHFYPHLMASGYLGVDIFFVISGFVITQSLLTHKTSSIGGYFLGFYTRRIKRLAPALVVCVAVTCLLIAFFNPEPQRHIKTGLFSLIGVSNWSLYFDELDYWGQSARFNPFTHTWSLGVEEQFYFLFPAVLWLTVFMRASKRLGLAIIAIAGACFVSLAAYIYFHESARSAVHYLPQFRVWQLGLGALAALYVASRDFAQIRALAAAPSVLLLGVIVLCLFAPDNLALWATVVATFATTLLILKGVAGGGVTSILEQSAVQYIGRISYSLYLWHWPVIVISLWTIGIHLWSLPLQLLLIFALGAGSYHFIERPLRHAPWTPKNLSLRTRLAVGAVAAALVIVVADSSSAKWLYLGSSEQGTAKQSAPHVSAKYCPGGDADAQADGKKKRAIRAIGNSHAYHILPALRRIAEDCNFRLLHTEQSDKIIYPRGVGVAPNKVRAALADLGKGDILIVSSLFRLLYQQPYLNSRGDHWNDHSAVKKAKGYGLDNWLKEFDDILAKTKKRGISVVLFLPNVTFNSASTSVPFELCLKEWFRIPSDSCGEMVERAYLDERFPKRWYEELRAREQRLQHLHLFDPMPTYCPGKDRCSRIVANTIAFRDTNHLTEAGALLMIEPLSRFLWESGLLSDEANQASNVDVGTSRRAEKLNSEAKAPASAKADDSAAQ